MTIPYFLSKCSNHNFNRVPFFVHNKLDHVQNRENCSNEWILISLKYEETLPVSYALHRSVTIFKNGFILFLKKSVLKTTNNNPTLGNSYSRQVHDGTCSQFIWNESKKLLSCYLNWLPGCGIWWIL